MTIFVALWYLGFPLYNIFHYLTINPFWTPVQGALYVLSITMYFWMLGNMLLGMKIPFLQRALPQDKKTEFHIITGTGILGGIIIHSLSKILTGYALSLVTWALLITLLLIFLMSIYWISTPILTWLHRILVRLTRSRPEKRYDLLKRLHGIGFFAIIILVYLHIREAGLPWLTDGIGRVIIEGCFWFTVGMSVLMELRRFFLPRVELKQVQCSEDLLILDFVSTGRRRVAYRAGQFAYLTPRSGPHRGEAHPFSFVPPVEVSADDLSQTKAGRRWEGRKTVSFAVRQTGDFTTWLQAAEGQEFTLDAAYGNFRPVPRHRNCLIGTGSGMAPILALLHEAPGAGAVTFLRGREQDSPLFDRIPSGAQCHILEQGAYINAELLSETLKTPRKFHYYLCTSPVVREKIVATLKSLGVVRRRIHFENYAYGASDTSSAASAASGKS